MSLPSQNGKIALVTGATAGIGMETAIELAAAGAQVVITGREDTRCRRALEEIKKRSGSTKVDYMLCDFESQAETRRLAAEFLEKYPALHILVNNAGTVYPSRELTADRIEKTFAVNHLGYFLLTNLLLDRVIASAPARIVCVASTGHLRGTMDFDDLGFERGGYSIMGAYSRSKLGNVMFVNELARRLAGKNVVVNSLHPGAVATNIWSHAQWWARPILSLAKRLVFVSIKEGADTMVWLATAPEAAEVTGKYFYKRKPRSINPLAEDAALNAKLWDVSAKLTGLA